MPGRNEWVGVFLVCAKHLLLEADSKAPQGAWGRGWYSSYTTVDGEQTLELHWSGFEPQLSHYQFTLNELLNLAEVPLFKMKPNFYPAEQLLQKVVLYFAQCLV